jgi:hypothetical protein
MVFNDFTKLQGNAQALTKFYNFVALVRERTIPTEQPPLVGEVSFNLLWIQRGVAY